MQYEPIIGLEIHAQLQTESKIFCNCSAQYGGAPNTHVCPVCLALPGALPVLNRRAVEYALRLALAMHCDVAPVSIFARKHYFYPDLPKGYQISQYDQPLCRDGFLEFEVANQARRIRIERIHLEEDAGKSIHAEEFVADDETLVDLNRCGVPLIEMVTAPELHSGAEAAALLRYLRQTVRYLGICDGNMAEGSLRCDANISIRKSDAERLGVKTELKNMNSIRGVENAIDFEINRQRRQLEKDERVIQQTLHWDDVGNQTIPMRSKEFAEDYRYFPEPNLMPLHVDVSWIAEVRESLPELPAARRNRLIVEYAIPEHDAERLTETPELADYFEQVATSSGDPALSSNWILGEVFRLLKEKQADITEFEVAPAALANLLRRIHKGDLSQKMAKSVFDEMVQTGHGAAEIIKAKGLTQISDDQKIAEFVAQVLGQHPSEVRKYLDGKTEVFGFLVGQVMKLSRGKANPQVVNRLLRTELEKNENF